MSKVRFLSSFANFGFALPTFHLSFHLTEHHLGLRARLRNKRLDLLMRVRFRAQQIQFLGFWAMTLLAGSGWIYLCYISFDSRWLFFCALGVGLTNEAWSKGVLFLVECSGDYIESKRNAASSHWFGIFCLLSAHKVVQVLLILFSHWWLFIQELILILLLSCLLMHTFFDHNWNHHMFDY